MTKKAQQTRLPVKYIIVDCPLGRLLVAGTERGVCTVGIGYSDSDTETEAEFLSKTPDAQRDDENPQLGEWATMVLEIADGIRGPEELPLDVEGTEFQWQVWRALMAIPYGSTLTYGAIARQLGNPAAMRAVGRACATNKVALVVPCHRAVGSDGKLHGFRWGLPHKERLLRYELAHASPQAAHMSLPQQQQLAFSDE